MRYANLHRKVPVHDPNWTNGHLVYTGTINQIFHFLVGESFARMTFFVVVA